MLWPSLGIDHDLQGLPDPGDEILIVDRHACTLTVS